MDREIVCHRGYRIEVFRRGPGWRAAIYRLGSLMPEREFPRGWSRVEVIAMATAFIDDQLRHGDP